MMTALEIAAITSADAYNGQMDMDNDGIGDACPEEIRCWWS